MIMVAKGSGHHPRRGRPDRQDHRRAGLDHARSLYAEAFRRVAAEVKTYQTQDEANQDLAAGRVDAVMADSIALQAFLDSDAGKACCDVVRHGGG